MVLLLCRVPVLRGPQPDGVLTRFSSPFSTSADASGFPWEQLIGMDASGKVFLIDQY
jgi:hypothetical protein